MPKECPTVALMGVMKGSTAWRPTVHKGPSTGPKGGEGIASTKGRKSGQPEGTAFAKAPRSTQNLRNKEKKDQKMTCLELGDGGVAGDVAGTGGGPCQWVSQPALTPFLTFPSTWLPLWCPRCRVKYPIQIIWCMHSYLTQVWCYCPSHLVSFSSHPKLQLRQFACT